MPQNTSATGTFQGNFGVKNITAQTVVKATPGRVFRVLVVVAGTGAGSINDAATVGAIGAANLIFIPPNTVGSTTLDFPCSAGIVVTPGTGQTLAVTYS